MTPNLRHNHGRNEANAEENHLPPQRSHCLSLTLKSQSPPSLAIGFLQRNAKSEKRLQDVNALKSRFLSKK